MNKLLAFAAIVEGATGVALTVVPSLVARLLVDADLSGVSIVVGRVAGIALLALGIACWPDAEGIRPALRALVTYNLLVALYLLYVGISGEWVGLLLWPAVVLHAVLTILLGRAWLMSPKNGGRNAPINP